MHPVDWDNFMVTFLWLLLWKESNYFECVWKAILTWAHVMLMQFYFSFSLFIKQLLVKCLGSVTFLWNKWIILFSKDKLKWSKVTVTSFTFLLSYISSVLNFLFIERILKKKISWFWKILSSTTVITMDNINKYYNCMILLFLLYL